MNSHDKFRHLRRKQYFFCEMPLNRVITAGERVCRFHAHASPACTPGWDAPKNGTFSVSVFSGIKFQNGRSFVCMDLHINELEGPGIYYYTSRYDLWDRVKLMDCSRVDHFTIFSPLSGEGYLKILS